jgi:hypothetical protein
MLQRELLLFFSIPFSVQTATDIPHIQDPTG